MKKSNYFLALSAFLVISTQACKKDDNEVKEETGEAKYAISITGTTAPTTSYLFSTPTFPSGTLGTSTALESPSSATIYKYGKYVYQNNFGAPATLRKYFFDAEGKPQEVGSFVIPGLKTMGAVSFTSETEAYATVAGFGSLPKLVKFNPSTMQVSSTIDLSGLLKTGATEMYYIGLVQRDNHIYMGVNYQDATFNNLEDKVFIAVIDKTTGTLVKLISDDRSSQMWNGGSESSFAANGLVKDSNGDIYVMGYANKGKPSGILKIKNGETTFDPAYFFDLNAATGKPCLGILHFGNGQTFTVRFDDATAYPFDKSTVFSCQYYKIDLANKTTSGNISSTIPGFKGRYAFATKFDNSKIYFNVNAATSNSIYSYKISDGAVAKEFDFSSGPCNGFAKIDQ
ncbi:MAG: hypothetical protein WKF66_07460 [Pedobacter sp.]